MMATGTAAAVTGRSRPHPEERMARPTIPTSPTPATPLTYEATGVNAAGAARSLTGLLASLRRTIPLRGRGQDGEVLLDFGHYANVIRVGDYGIAISTDGVGSK